MSHAAVVGLGRQGRASGGSSGPNGGDLRSSIPDLHLARLLGASENVLQEYRSVTELQAVKSALGDKRTYSENSHADPFLSEMLLMLVGCLENFEKRVTNNEARCEKLNEMVVEQDKKIEKHWDWLQQATKHQADALFKAMKRLNLLEAAAVKGQSDRFEIEMEKHLNDARSFICLMFVHRFPSCFPRNDLVNVFDTNVGSVVESVIWFDFLVRLQTHFFRYHKPKSKHTRDELWQTCSVFQGITGTKGSENPTGGGDALGVSKAGDDAQTDVTQAARYDMAVDTPQEAEVSAGRSPDNPNALPVVTPPVKVIRNFDLVATFQPKRISTCTRDGRFLKKPPYENVKYRLEFFIPLFIWTYNDIKRRLHEIDTDIRSKRNEKKNQDALITHFQTGGTLQDGQRDSMGDDPNERAETLFSVGTGLEVRNSEERRKFVLANRRMEDPEASAHRSGNLKRKANEETHDPGLNEPSSPEKRGASRALFVADIKTMFSGMGTVYSKDASRERSRSQLARISGSDTSRSLSSDRASSTSPPQSSPLSSGLRGTSAAVPQSFVQMAIGNAMLRLRDLEESLANLEQDRKAILKELQIYGKGLAILLDANLLKFVIGVPVEELISKSGEHDKSSWDMNYEAELIRIADVLFKNNDEYDYHSGNTERAIDTFLSEKNVQIATTGRITDFLILLLCLDQFLPVPSYAEETWTGSEVSGAR